MKCFFSFINRYELDNGQTFSQSGSLKNVGEDSVVIVSGQYSFVGPDGITYWVDYVADEDGFHPVVGTGSSGLVDGVNGNSESKSLVGK